MKNISDILREEREKQGISIADVVNTTKIKKSFITAIEQGRFEELPSDTYAMGFVKNYAQFLGISEDRAAALLRREYETKRIEVLPRFRKTNRPVRKLILRSPRGYLILAVGMVVLSYVIYQFSFLLFGPKLVVTSPKMGEVVASSIARVEGKTDPYATVSINREGVYVDIAGNFKKAVYVYTGKNKIEVIAKNRYGKETKKEIIVRAQ